jgi:hypothetical protein
MSSIADRLPDLADEQLVNLRANTTRLSTAGTDRQRAEAETLLPLVDAEIADRKSKLPPPKTPVRKPRATTAGAVKKPAAPKAPAKARKTAEA